MKDKIEEVEATSVPDSGLEISTVVRPSRIGRPMLGDRRLTPREARERHNQALRESGGRIMTIRLRNREACEALIRLTKERAFKSETAAATWLLEQSLKILTLSVSENSEGQDPPVGRGV